MIKREMYMKRIRPFIGTDLIKVMTGIRRCGKSVMLELIKQELIESGIKPKKFISINFEDMNYAHLQTAQALHEAITKLAAGIEGKVYLFFDEIQDESIPKCFQKYLISGGMPYLANIRYADAPTKQYLHDLFNSVQLKDIVKRNKIRDVDLLERIIAYVMANVGNTFSATSVAKFLKSERRTVASETIMNYLKYCCDAYLFYQVKREDLQGKQILASNEKYYIADHGIREAVFGGNIRQINLTLENIVYLELIRRGYEVTIGKYGEKEIDFVCHKQEDKLYVQVTYLLASEETIQREFGVYNSIEDNYPKYVVSLDELDMSQNGIKHYNIRDFLLAQEWK